MVYSKGDNEKGVVLLLTMMILIIISAVTVSFLYMTSIQTKVSGANMVDAQAFWLSEAGMQKAVWNLMTPVITGGKGESWTTASVTESLGNGSYNLKVERWDWALASNGAAVSASSSKGASPASRAIDGNSATYWESNAKPTVAVPQYITVVFPYTLKLNKARFLSPTNNWQPQDYQWQVSADGTSYSTVLVVTSNADLDRTDEFHPARTGVKYIRLFVTSIQAAGASSGVRVAAFEAIGSKITSAGTVENVIRKIEQTVIIDDGRPTVYDAVTYTPSAYDQIDWREIP